MLPKDFYILYAENRIESALCHKWLKNQIYFQKL